MGWNGRTDGSFNWNYVDVKAFTVRPAIWVEVSSTSGGSTNSTSGGSYSSSNRNKENKCRFMENGKEVCDNPCASGSNFCDYHTQYLYEIYHNVKERYESLTGD